MEVGGGFNKSYHGGTKNTDEHRENIFNFYGFCCKQENHLGTQSTKKHQKNETSVNLRALCVSVVKEKGFPLKKSLFSV